MQIRWHGTFVLVARFSGQMCLVEMSDRLFEREQGFSLVQTRWKQKQCRGRGAVLLTRRTVKHRQRLSLLGNAITTS